MTNLYICAVDDADTLSYYQDWRDAFARAGFRIANLRHASKYDVLSLGARSLLGCRWIVLGHSSYYKLSHATRYYLTRLLPRLPARKVFFLDNEYREFGAKLEFARRIDADVIVSQFPQDVAERFYAPHISSRILSLPHALNPEAFTPGRPLHERPIDLGARSFDFAYYLGDRDRYRAERFAEGLAMAAGLKVDISSDPSKRFNRPQWAEFLRSCKMTVASEAGSGYIEFDDRTRWAVDTFQAENPGVSFDVVHERFFAAYTNPISGKIISPRHFEAAGTKTCQILVKGRYNDILEAGVHYLPLLPNLSNAEEIRERIRDDRHLALVADCAYEHVRSTHTYRHRVEALLAFLGDA